MTSDISGISVVTLTTLRTVVSLPNATIDDVESEKVVVSKPFDSDVVSDSLLFTVAVAVVVGPGLFVVLALAVVVESKLG